MTYNTLMSFSKRLFDLAFALIALVILSPIILAIALLVRVFIGTPILFKQERPGYKGQPFVIYKFRTMTNRLARDGNLLPDAERLTRFGRLLRSLSLDELPELFNIVRGEMSFVGPRPLLMEYLPLYSPKQAHRHDVVPGLTGWAQVNGRNATDWPTRFDLDTWYVDNWSFWLDIRIILLTVWKVFSREGINQEGQATVKYFKGEQ
jgi:sugar transferase EpsL